jgi:hypothetical protein
MRNRDGTLAKRSEKALRGLNVHEA